MKSSVFLFIIMLMLTFSCSNENVTVSDAKTDRLSFSDMAAFNETFLLLSKMTTTEELDQWAANKNHSTLLNSEDPAMENYSIMLKTILNKDYEFQVGEDVIWFHEGTLYTFSKAQLPNMNALKKTPENCAKFGQVTTTAVGTQTGDTNGKVNGGGVNFGGVNAQNQRQFTQQKYQKCQSTLGNAVGNRKYVHELFDETYAVNPGPVRYSYLYLRIKLEWKGSGSWKAAGEQRQTTVTVSGTYQVVGSGLGTGNFSINTANDCYSGAWYIAIASATTGPWYSQPPYWYVTMDGTIYHRVKGDVVANAWTNTNCEGCSPATSMLW